MTSCTELTQRILPAAQETSGRTPRRLNSRTAARTWAARAWGSYVVDSVCPLVTKVHHEVRVRSGKGYRIVYVGHEGHEEAVGTMAVAPEAISRVESVAEVEALEQFDEPVALLAQTTLSHRDWNDVAIAVKQRYPDAWTPGRSDLCFATTNRQSALMELAARCGAILVIGSANSSNTRALEKLAREAGCERVARINTAAEIPAEFFDPSLVVGVTAGASAPNEVVEQVISTLDPRDGVELGARPPKKTNTFRPHGTSATCRRPSRSPQQRCSAALRPMPREWTTAP